MIQLFFSFLGFLAFAFLMYWLVIAAMWIVILCINAVIQCVIGPIEVVKLFIRNVRALERLPDNKEKR